MDFIEKLTTETSNVENLKQYQQIKRGRGRPRKNQIIIDVDKNKKNKMINNSKSVQKIMSPLIDKDQDEEIILHLPILFKDLDTSIFENKTTSSPNLHPNIFTINDINSSSESNNSNCDNNDIMIMELKQKMKNQEKLITTLQKDINDYKLLLNETSNIGVNNRKVSKLNLNLINVTTGKPIVEEKTDIACWWCTYNFETMPCFIPEKIVNDMYYVFGCFCSPNCAATYNLKMDDSQVWHRYCLLKKLYSFILNANGEINIAPLREAYAKFGGPISYDEYRKNCIKCTKEYRLIMPPMTSIVPLIEEGCVDSTKVNVSLADLNKKNVLRRTKPLPNVKNTLFETLGIKEK